MTRELEIESTKLATEREILQRTNTYLRRGVELVSRFQFVAVKQRCDCAVT